MPIQVLINISIAVLWMFLQDNWSILTFFSGYLIGLLVLFILRRYLNHPFYVITLFNVIRLLLIFFQELFASSIFVLKHVIRPKIVITPGIFKLETDLKGEMEVTILSLLITLTPGSVVVEVSPDYKVLYVHAMDLPESKELVLKSKAKFEQAIKRVTR